MGIMGAIFKVVQEIAKAASTARRNRDRCQDLADRLRTLGDLLRDSNAAKDRDTRKRVLHRLWRALDYAHKLVYSCRRAGWLYKFLAAGRDSGRFDDVERRIENCLRDLNIANYARLESQLNRLAAPRLRSPDDFAGRPAPPMEYDFRGRSGSSYYGAPTVTTVGAGSFLYRHIGQPSHGAATAPPRAAPYHHAFPSAGGKQTKEKAAAPRTGAAGMHRPPAQHHQQGAGRLR